MITVLVTGANGQLGSEIRKCAGTEKYIFTDLAELDITDNLLLENFIKDKRPNYLINCAAYTAVDKAEDEHDLAMRLNSNAVKEMAVLSKKYDFHLVHISTDFVFNGNKNIPYSETDLTDPQSFYGASKLEGEIQILNYASKYTIIRTAWLYSQFGGNFVKTMMKYGRERGLLNVVFDQVGTPTYAADLASLICQLVNNNQLKSNSIYHYSNEGAISWFDFAKAIIEISGISCKINPILSHDFPAKAKRPAYSVLDKTKIKTDFGIEIPYWKDSLQKCLKFI